MKAIKDFLKPNWWKIILFIIILLFLYVYMSEYMGGELWDFPMSCIGNMTGGCSPTGEEGINLCWDAYERSKPCLIANLFILTIGLYLLSCLIYLIISKIKRLIIKPK